MATNVRCRRLQSGFATALGLFVLGVLAVLVGLYLYNADVRRVGDGALDQARAYKDTIATDYARFYQCMRAAAPVTVAAAPKVPAVAAAPERPVAAESSPILIYPPYPDYPAYPAYPQPPAGLSPRGMPGQSEPAAAPAAEGWTPDYPAHPSAMPYPRAPDYPPQGGPGAAGHGAPSGPSYGPPPGAPPRMPSPYGAQSPYGMQPGGPAPGMAPAPRGMPAMPGGYPRGPLGPGMQPGMPYGAMPPPGAPSMQPGGIQPGGMGMPHPGMGSDGSGGGPNWQVQRQPPEPAFAGPYGRGPDHAPPPMAAGSGWGGPQPMPPGGSAPPTGDAAFGGIASIVTFGAGQAEPPVPGEAPQAAAPADAAKPTTAGPAAAPADKTPAPAEPATVQPAAKVAAAPSVAQPGTRAPATPAQGANAAPVAAEEEPPLLPEYAGAPVVGQMPEPLHPQIVAAREAYARQQFLESIRAYRAYLARDPSNPSAFGEMGNVLLAAGRPHEAAQAYYEASDRLLDAGQPGAVYLLLPYIEQHDPLLAAVLMRRLTSLPRSIY